LSGASAATNLGRIADPDLVAEVVKQTLEPLAVAARFDADADLAALNRILCK
jgi:hypothetical protein